MTFSEKLVALRKQSGMSQEELADQLNTSRQAVSKWENGRGYPETEKILTIGNIFSVSADYLLKDDPSAFENSRECGYYASRETVEGYITEEEGRVRLLSGGVAVIIAAGGIPAEAVMLGFIAVGIILLILFGFQEYLRPNKYKPLREEPLVFDRNFLRDFKEDYHMIMRKYVGRILAAVAIIFAALIAANIWEGQWADAGFLILIALAAHIMIDTGYMISVHDGIIESDKRKRK